MTQTIAKLLISRPSLQLKSQLRFPGQIVGGGFISVTMLNGVATISSLDLVGDVTSSANVTNVGKINGTSLSGLATGILKNTTATGVPSIAIAADFPILNQSTTGNAATVTTNANLTGDVTSVGNATTLTNAPVIAKVLTGYVSGPGTVSATDSILSAIQKLNGNDATNANLTGPITSVGNATTIAANAVTNANLATMGAFSFKVNNTNAAASPTDITIDGLTAKASPAAGDEVIIWDVAGAALKKATVSSVSAAGSVSSIAGNTGAFTLGIGLTNTVNDIEVSLSKLTNALGADVALNNTANYFDGPSVAQGTSGTWFASGTVTLVDTVGVASFIAKLWDGTTVIASARSASTAAGNQVSLTLSGYITSPAANIRISCRDTASTNGKIVFNDSGNSKDSTISVLRIA